MLEIASKMFLCLLIAALIGDIIGYLIGRMLKCDNKEKENKEDMYHNFYHRETQSDTINKENDIRSSFYNQKPAMLTSKKEEVEAESIDDDVDKTLQKIVSEEMGIVPASEIEKIEKPHSLTMPINGKADDLKEISGIGLKIEKILNDLGVFHFSQIANWTEENLRWIDDNLDAFKGRAKREKWIEQAKILAEGGETDFSKRVRNGEIDRY